MVCTRQLCGALLGRKEGGRERGGGGIRCTLLQCRVNAAETTREIRRRWETTHFLSRTKTIQTLSPNSSPRTTPNPLPLPLQGCPVLLAR